MLLGENLKRFRKEAHLTQLELGKKIGVVQNDIHRWEADKVVPSIETLKKLSIALNVSIDNLLFSDKEKKKFKIADKEFFERLKDVEHLSSADKEAVVRMIDGLKLRGKTEK